MHGPTPGPRFRPPPTDRTWGSVLATWAAAATLPLLFWAVSRPLAAAAVLAAGVGLYVGARRAARLVRCLRDCRRVAFDVAGSVRITVTLPPTDDPC